MRGMESNDSYTISRELQRALYKPNCGYRYDTGGVVHNLRYSTNNEKVKGKRWFETETGCSWISWFSCAWFRLHNFQIRKFHKQFYCPLNTTIVVAGSVDIDKLLEICHEFEEKLINKVNFQKMMSSFVYIFMYYIILHENFSSVLWVSKVEWFLDSYKSSDFAGLWKL